MLVAWQDLEADIVEQDDFERPNLAACARNVGRQIRLNPGAVLVGHSLGTVLIAHLARQAFPIGAALIVAPVAVDENPNLCKTAPEFAPIPTHRFPFPSIVVRSTNDPLMSVDRASRLAEDWGSRFVHLGNSGHINPASGYGPWPGASLWRRSLWLDAFAADSNRGREVARRPSSQAAIAAEAANLSIR